MKWTLKIFTLIFVIALQSCGVDICDVDCNSGPLSLNFKLVDKATGEDLFNNGSFDPANIMVLDRDNNNAIVPYIFNNENDRNNIILGPFGVENEIARYTLNIADLTIFNLKIDANEDTEGCCTFIQLNELRITGSEFELNEDNGVYRILVEL